MGLLGMGCILYRVALIYGWKAVFMYYFIPYVVSKPSSLPSSFQLTSILAVQSLVCCPHAQTLPSHADYPHLGCRIGTSTLRLYTRLADSARSDAHLPPPLRPHDPALPRRRVVMGARGGRDG